MRFAFEGGNAQDPEGKEGLAHFLAGMLDEGAGDLTSKQFQERMEEIAMRMSFEDARDAFYGSFETLTENRDKAVALLALALDKPRFDADAVDRVRGQLQAGLAHAARDPDRVASDQWAGDGLRRPSLRPAGQRHAGVGAEITRDDLAKFWSRTFATGQPARGGGRRHRCRRRSAKMLDTVFGAAAGQGQADAGRQDEPQPRPRS